MDNGNITLSRLEEFDPGAAGPTTGTLSGSIAMQGRGKAGDPRWAVLLTVRFLQPGTSTLVFSGAPTTTTTGGFTVNGVPPGTYDVEVKHLQTLTRKATNLVFTAGSSTSQSFGTLLTGDVNNSDSVTISDFSILRSVFGLSQGNAGFDPRADLNANGSIDILDFSLLRANFGVSGPVAAGVPVVDVE